MPELRHAADGARAVRHGGGRRKNADYCLYCYRDGAFAQDCTMEEMIDFCATIYAREMPGLSKDAARAQLRAFFPQLKRWKRP